MKIKYEFANESVEIEVEENANVDEVVRIAMKQLINRYSEEVINELLQLV